MVGHILAVVGHLGAEALAPSALGLTGEAARVRRRTSCRVEKLTIASIHQLARRNAAVGQVGQRSADHTGHDQTQASGGSDANDQSATCRREAGHAPDGWQQRAGSVLSDAFWPTVERQAYLVRTIFLQWPSFMGLGCKGEVEV